MEIAQVAEKIPIDVREAYTEKMVDVLLGSKNAEKMPSWLAKTILLYWQRDQLTTDTGVEKLLEAGAVLEPKTTFKILDNDFGLKGVAKMFKEAIGLE